MSQPDQSVIGTIVEIKEPTVRGEWQSIEFAIKLSFGNDKYPNFSVFEISNKSDAEHNNVENLTECNKVGDEVTVNFWHAGFSWIDKKDGVTRKYATKLKAWRVSKYEGAPVENDFDKQAAEAFDEPAPF